MCRKYANSMPTLHPELLGCHWVPHPICSAAAGRSEQGWMKMRRMSTQHKKLGALPMTQTPRRVPWWAVSQAWVWAAGHSARSARPTLAVPTGQCIPAAPRHPRARTLLPSSGSSILVQPCTTWPGPSLQCASLCARGQV